MKIFLFFFYFYYCIVPFLRTKRIPVLHPIQRRIGILSGSCGIILRPGAHAHELNCGGKKLPMAICTLSGNVPREGNLSGVILLGISVSDALEIFDNSLSHCLNSVLDGRARAECDRNILSLPWSASLLTARIRVRWA